MRIIDLSAPIRPTPPGVAEFMRTEIAYNDHGEGAKQIEQLFAVPARLLRDGEGWATETITCLGTHGSTHVDAPYHYNSVIAGERAQTIDELPLELFFGPGVVADFDGRPDGEAIGAGDMAAAIEAAGHELRPGDIVLVHTGRDTLYDQPDYPDHGPGVSADATRWLF